jgi:hypothetical protein
MSDKGLAWKETGLPGDYFVDKRMWKDLGSLRYEKKGQERSWELHS